MNESPGDTDELAEQLDGLTAVASMRHLVVTGMVRPIREAAGVTQADIARVVGCVPSAVAGWESNRRVPSGDRALRYAAALAECLRLTDVES